MTAYAIGLLHPQPPLHEDVFVYMERIQATMDPFGGRFITHGKTPEVHEGTFDGAVVILEFPDMDRARGWYDSPAYQEIIPMRADHIPSVIMLVDGVGADHDSAALGAALRAAQRG
ncbi:DUF1330 domain-containing protein [Actinomadura sp. LD22]|uniref:DUF1330 domain-containing protein n=1 Tax=Actinomadura physcomitrii TaxID=2650748 RepID=A0A6I4MJN3_9ACTN|nr:DUF1330 domain-containing protein [Actinomadura physcomitrii]MWA03821.1 DUF1330 domain-containing protein [Actinomadura physcomitrii]